MSIILTNGRTQNIDLTRSFNRQMRYETLSQLDNLKPTDGETQTNEKNHDDWAFDVYQERAKTSRGFIPIFANLRKDDGEYLGHYKSLSLLPNIDLHNAICAELDKHGFKDYSMDATVYKGGKRVRFVYTLNQFEIDGELFNRKLEAFNSYDGVWLPSACWFHSRQICLNDAWTTEKSFAMNKKHSPTLDAKKLAAGIMEGINKNNKADEVKLRQLKQTPIEDAEVLNVLGNITKFSKGKLSLPLATRIALNWIAPDKDEEKMGNNWWRLFNAGTRAMRDLEKIGQRRIAQDAARTFSGQVILAFSPEISSFAKGAKEELLKEPPKAFSLLKQAKE